MKVVKSNYFGHASLKQESRKTAESYWWNKRARIINYHCFKSWPIYRYISQDTSILSKTIR